MEKKKKKQPLRRGLPRAEKNKMQSLRLPEGKTCSDCKHYEKCEGLMGTMEDEIDCLFYPNKFKPWEK